MEEVEAIAKTRMHPRHNRLNALLTEIEAEHKDTRATSTNVIPAPREPEGHERN